MDIKRGHTSGAEGTTVAVQRGPIHDNIAAPTPSLPLAPPPHDPSSKNSTYAHKARARWGQKGTEPCMSPSQNVQGTWPSPGEMETGLGHLTVKASWTNHGAGAGPGMELGGQARRSQKGVSC